MLSFGVTLYITVDCVDGNLHDSVANSYLCRSARLGTAGLWRMLVWTAAYGHCKSIQPCYSIPVRDRKELSLSVALHRHALH